MAGWCGQTSNEIVLLRVEGKTTTTSTKTEAKTKRQMNTKESLIMNSEHQPLVLFSVENQVMLKSYLTFQKNAIETLHKLRIETLEMK